MTAEPQSDATPAADVASDAASDAAQVTRIAWEGSLDVRVAEQLHQQIAEALANSGPVVVDGTEIDSLDAAVLQLLLAAKKEAGERFTFDAPEGSNAALWIHVGGAGEPLLNSAG